MNTTEENNKKLVLEAFDTLFNIVTMRRPNVIGNLTTFSIAIISSLAERAVQPHQEPSANAEIRTGNDRGRRKFRNCSRPLFGIWATVELDRR